MQWTKKLVQLKVISEDPDGFPLEWCEVMKELLIPYYERTKRKVFSLIK